jgi:translation initiation factor 2B subunit (eIF-2B alpha/beta/delta family)
LLQQLASRDAAIAQLEQRCAELAITVKRVEADAVSMSAVVELATQYITATDPSVSGAAYLELRRAVAERLAR